MKLCMNLRYRSKTFATLALRITAAIALPAIAGIAQTSAGMAQLTAGPAYTGSDGKSSPKFPNIDLAFELKDADGAPIAARPSDLKLFSQGQEIGTATSVRTFEQAGYGITSILTLDVSGSMKGEPLNAIHASIAKFVSQTRAQDRVAVLTFADQTQIDVPFGASQAALANELQTVQVRGKSTRLYDGLLDALTLFTNAQPRRRQLLVISDGHDEGSAHTLTEVMLRAKSMGVVINSIGLTNKDRGEYLASLLQLSRETGGTFVPAQSARDLEALIGRGIEVTLATPVAAFRLSHLDADDNIHAMQLRWQPGGDEQASSLTAPAFVRTPKRSLLRNFIPDRISDLWTWALGGCFAAGVILLVLSWRGAHPKAVSNPAPKRGHRPAPVTPLAPSASAFAVPSLASIAPVRAAVRTPTLSEHAPKPIAHEAVGSTKVESTQRDKTVIERTRTPAAVFFDAPASGPFARIQIINGDLAGQNIPVITTNFSIGAATSNNLVLSGDLTISSEHIRLLWENSILKIEDRNSTNGTYVNAQRLAPGRHLLKPGDEIRIGRTILVVGRV
jgi:Mg-chelatase subunit ChlD